MKVTYMIMRIVPDGNTEPYDYTDYFTESSAELAMIKHVKNNPDLKFFIVKTYQKSK